MGNKIIEILQMPKTEESISLLCNLCHIESYQASKIIDEFQKIEKMENKDTAYLLKEKWQIIDRLRDGYYATDEAKKNDLENQILEILKLDNIEKATSYLCELCEIEAVDAIDIISRYQQLEQEEKGLLGAEQEKYEELKMQIVHELMMRKGIKL